MTRRRWRRRRTVSNPAPVNARGYPGIRFSLAFHLEDCTGCGLCVEACPALSPSEPGVRAVNLADKADRIEPGRTAMAFFEALPVNDRARVDFHTVRGVQFLEPTFEFSGACAGCGETPYLKLLSQLFGDRLMVANATGCSSIYGGNLPVTPWSKTHEGRGPAWSNSLFEDNAEFGLGFRLAADKHLQLARDLLHGLAPEIGADLGRGHHRRPANPRIGDPGAARTGRRVEDPLAGDARQRCGARSVVGRRSSGAPVDLARGRRWLGL